MASVTPIIHDPNAHTYCLTPGQLGLLCSNRMMAGEAYAQPKAFPEYWMGTLLRYASQEYPVRDPYEFGKQNFDFIRRLPNGPTFVAAYIHEGVLWDIEHGHWPSFNVFSAKNRLRIMRRAVRLLWVECWQDWLFSIDFENQLQLYEDSEWAVLQGILPTQTAYERLRTTALRWIRRHPYQAAEQIAEAVQREYRYRCQLAKSKAL